MLDEGFEGGFEGHGGDLVIPERTLFVKWLVVLKRKREFQAGHHIV